jgi:hypothetical protein
MQSSGIESLVPQKEKKKKTEKRRKKRKLKTAIWQNCSHFSYVRDKYIRVGSPVLKKTRTTYGLDSEPHVNSDTEQQGTINFKLYIET